MSIEIGIGFSQETQTSTAAREAAFQALTQSRQDHIDCAIVFSTVHYNPLETLHTVQRTLNPSRIIGGSTAGILLSESIETQGIAVLALASKDVQFGIGHTRDIRGQDLHIAGNSLARNTVSDFSSSHRSIFLLLSDGLLRDGSLLVKGAQEILGNVFPIIGAGTSDNFRFQETYQYFQDQSMNDSAVGLLMGGHISVGIGSKHGWKPLGKPRFADRTEGSVIKQIDGKRASSLYEEFFGTDLSDLRSGSFAQKAYLHPLGIYIEGESEYLLRNALEVRPDGSIICQGNVPQGSEVHIMIGNKDFCKRAALEAAQEVKDALLGKTPKLIIIFESFSRNKILRRSAIQEIQMVKEILGTDTPLIGMYTYGEIAPVKSLERFGSAHLLNETITIAGIV
ncbi:MAG: FIST N-terminal domain-containing protein [Candidatus Omnitrophota bacterium]